MCREESKTAERWRERGERRKALLAEERRLEQNEGQGIKRERAFFLSQLFSLWLVCIQCTSTKGEDGRRRQGEGRGGEGGVTE